jgi:ABC-2 type transport system permease protein
VTGLIRGELIKLRTTRTALGFAVGVALVTLAIVLITVLAGNPKTIADKRSALAVGSTISALLLLFGVVGSGAEYRHRTLAPALLVAPARGRLLSSRIIAYACAGLLIGLAMAAVAFAVGLPLLSGQPGPSLRSVDYLRAAGGSLLTIVLSSILGVGVGTLVGNQIAAVIGSLVWIFMIEPLSNLVGSISKFTIGQTATAIAGDTGGKTLPWAAAVAVLLGWTLAFVGAAILIDRRRDID